MQDPGRNRNIVVVGASAGGVEALRDLLRHLPAELAAPVLVVLHIPAYEPSRLDRILAPATPLKVVAAQDGQVLEPGVVYVASADRHLMVESGMARLTRGPKECRVRPAIDVLFRSAALAYGAGAIGVVLSGMLDDGTAGLWAIKDQGGLAFVQQPSEAMHDSMPESAIKHVEVDFVGPLAAVAEKIIEAVGQSRPRQAGAGLAVRYATEVRIAGEGNGLQAGVMDLGKVSKYTCPDCHGVLVQMEEGPIVRFRCHTGHAFSLKTLIAEVNASIDTGLWDAIRAVEERVMLLRQMGELAQTAGDGAETQRCRRDADDAEKRLQPLRELVLDPTFFGHDPAG
jgi:two-component system chemotaxis response regulator CheB